MRNWFRKYRPPLLIGSIVLLGVLSFAVLVQSFKSTNCLAAWIFNFMNDWAIILYASVTFLLAIAAFWGIREGLRERVEERHREALERMRNWSEQVFEVVTRPTRQPNLKLRKKELNALITSVGPKAIGILHDAERLGGDINLYVKFANLIIFKFTARLGDEGDIAKFRGKYNIEETINPISNVNELEEAKRELLEAFGDVIKSATARLVPLEPK